MKTVFRILVYVLILTILTAVIGGITFAIYINHNRQEKTATADAAIGTPAEHRDYVGRLSIPSENIDIALLSADDGKTAQTIVDVTDCGVYMADRVYNNWVIGDHSYQGFSNISNLQPGDEIEVIDKEGNATKYTVTKSFIGWNDGGLKDWGKNPISKDSAGGILYTCLIGTKIVRIVYCDVQTAA